LKESQQYNNCGKINNIKMATDNSALAWDIVTHKMSVVCRKDGCHVLCTISLALTKPSKVIKKTVKLAVEAGF
jgi:hypothetical protein